MSIGKLRWLKVGTPWLGHGASTVLPQSVGLAEHKTPRSGVHVASPGAECEETSRDALGHRLWAFFVHSPHFQKCVAARFGEGLLGFLMG